MSIVLLFKRIITNLFISYQNYVWNIRHDEYEKRSKVVFIRSAGSERKILRENFEEISHFVIEDAYLTLHNVDAYHLSRILLLLSWFHQKDYIVYMCIPEYTKVILWLLRSS